MAFLRTTEVLNALESTLEGLTFPEGHDFESENIFGSVRLYDVGDIEAAIKDLFEYGQQRLCFIIPVGDDLRSDQRGNKLSTTKKGRYSLLLSDQDYEPGKPSVFGDDTRPGLINIKDDLIEALVGETIGIRGAIVEPLAGESYRFKNKSTPQGREAYVLELLISMGRMEKTLNRGSTTYR